MPKIVNADDPLEIIDFFGAYWQFHHAAVTAKTPAEHVWQLELALHGLHRAANPKVIHADERDALFRNMVEARLVSERALTGQYPAEQIELGYRAAHCALNMWAIPVDERPGRYPPGPWAKCLTMFAVDIANMRRANEIAQGYPRMSLDELLPPLPRMIEPADGCEIIPFPTVKR